MAPSERGAAPARRPLDPLALAQVTRRLNHAAAPPWLHTEVARRMASRLPIIRLQPDRVIDWGAFLGGSGQLLSRTYPHARIIAVESDAARRDATRATLAAPWWALRRWRGDAAEGATEAELGAAAGQLLWANMGLHRAADPQAVMAAWHRALAVDGFLMFSTLGPGTLPELRAIYAEQHWPPPFAPFVDMHDLGDMLVAAGFADPVMDQEPLTLTWASGAALLDELRLLGGNVDVRRGAGLRTPRWRRRLESLLEVRSDGTGRVALTFEIVYGHAFRPLPRPRLEARTEVPLDDLRAMARAGRSHT